MKALQRLQAAGWDAPARRCRQTTCARRSAACRRSEVPIFDYPGPPAPPDAHVLEARYSRPYQMHGSIGPSCAVGAVGGRQRHRVDAQPGRLSAAQGARRAAAPAAEHACAASTSKARAATATTAPTMPPPMRRWPRAPLPGRPVRVQWMREQEHGWEPLRLGDGRRAAKRTLDATAASSPGTRRLEQHAQHAARPRAGGLLAGAEVEPPFAPPSRGRSRCRKAAAHATPIPLYAPAQCARRPSTSSEQMPVRVSALRGLGAHMNVFAIESFMDELAQAAGADPVEFRLRHLRRRARARRRAARGRHASAGRRRAGGRRPGRGFAFARYKNLAAYCAVAMEVEVDRDTRRDRGAARGRRGRQRRSGQPDGIRNQIEGGIVQSPSWTLHEAVAFDATAPHQLRLERLSDPALPRGAGDASRSM